MTSSAKRPQIEFAWSAHPARRHLGRALVGALVIFLLAAGAAAVMQHWWWGVVAALVMLAALNRFYFPSRFEIDGRGIVAIYPLRRQGLRWTAARRFVADREGGYLSTRARPSRLDAYRGMHVIFNARRDEIVKRINQHLPEGAARCHG